MDRIFEAWLRWPIAARWISGVGLLWIVSALLPAFRERRPAAAFGENLVALGLHYGLIMGGLALGIWIGMRTADRTGKHWLGWVVGIMLFMVVSGAQYPLANFFGVQDVLEQIENTPSPYDS